MPTVKSSHSGFLNCESTSPSTAKTSDSERAISAKPLVVTPRISSQSSSVFLVWDAAPSLELVPVRIRIVCLSPGESANRVSVKLTEPDVPSPGGTAFLSHNKLRKIARGLLPARSGGGRVSARLATSRSLTAKALLVDQRSQYAEGTEFESRRSFGSNVSACEESREL